MADPTAPMPADDPASAPADGSAPADDSGAGPTVLCTVLDNGDGTYTLVQGDESDTGAGASAPPDAGAMPAPGGDMGAPPAGPQGQSFDSVGALLKGILDLVKAAQDSGPDGSAESNFSAGFDGGSAASPTKSGAGAIAQKY